MNIINAQSESPDLESYNVSIETSAAVTPATLHTVSRLLEGLGCTLLQQLTINTEEASNEQ